MGVMPQHRTNVNKHLSMQDLSVANILAFLETIINVCSSEPNTSQMCCVGSSLEHSGQFTWLWIIIDWLRSIANQSIMVNITMSSASPGVGHAKNVIHPGERRAHLVRWPDGEIWSRVKTTFYTQWVCCDIYDGAGLWLWGAARNQGRETASSPYFIKYYFPGNGRLDWGAGQFNIVQIQAGKLALISPLPWPVPLCVTHGTVTTLTSPHPARSAQYSGKEKTCRNSSGVWSKRIQYCPVTVYRVLWSSLCFTRCQLWIPGRAGASVWG